MASVAAGGRSRQACTCIRPKSLQNKGRPDLQSTETIDGRQPKRVPWEVSKEGKATARLSSHPILPFCGSTCYFAALCFRGRRTPRRLITILPCFLRITLSPTPARQTLSGQASSFIPSCLPLSTSLARYEVFPRPESGRLVGLRIRRRIAW